MKKVFLTMMMLLFAVTGVMRADEVTIGSLDGAADNSYLPMNSLYDYSFTEQIYTFDEIGMAGTINSITMWLYGNANLYEMPFDIYMVETDKETFASTADWVAVTAADIVYSGSVTVHNTTAEAYTFTLDTPFAYAGTGNLVIAFNNKTGNWKSGLNGKVFGASSDPVRALYARRDGTIYDPTNPGAATSAVPQRNVVTIDITAAAAGALTTNPSPLDLGYRPTGAWMAPYVFNFEISGAPTTINALDLSGDYFTANVELPATVNASRPLEVELTTGEAADGVVNSTLTVLYGSSKDAAQFNVTATAYTPANGDVYEKAIEVPTLDFRTPYESELPEILYKNYELPDGTINTDAVYKVTFADDVLLYAGANSANASAFLYTEDFEEVGGPAEDNNYEYNGPQVNPGPQSLWWYYNYTGTNTWYGTSAGGGFYFGYKISTDVIAENELAGLTITQVEAAAREAYPYYCYIIEGGSTPFDGDLIGYGEIENPDALYFFDIDLEEPAYISGNQDIWVIFYSDSPYAAYCGRTPADVNNGKIWTYNPNASSPMWSSNTSYTPVIYARMLELPTGREVNMNLASMEIKQGNGTISEVATAEGNVMNVAKASLRNRADETLTVYDGTATNNTVPMYLFYFDDFTRSQFIIPATELTAMTGGQIKSLKYYTTNYNIPYTTASTFDIFLKEVTETTLSAYVAKEDATIVYHGTGEIVSEGEGGSITITFTTPFTYNGGNLLIGCENTTDAGYKNISFYGESGHSGAAASGYNSASTANATFGAKDFLPKTTFTYTPASAPTPPTPAYEPWACPFNCQIDAMYVPAGTYYLVFASDVVRDVVNIGIAEVPVPEQATIIAPADGASNITAPYLAEWVLGDYTTEFQVLCGTQYPPTTVMIDWTDYLVESAFITELEGNKNYFMQVNARNSAGTTMGEVIGFTTPITPVEGFAVAEANLYPGDAAEFTWEANERTLMGYNIYKDGQLVNVEGPITGTEYSVEGLEYNMAGYAFTIRSVYGAGESADSEPVYVYMTGTGTVSGHVYDTDVDHPVANIPVTLLVLDEYGQDQAFEAMTDENGFYTAEILAGPLCMVGVSAVNGEAFGYGAAVYFDPATGLPYFAVDYQGVYENIDIITHEYYYPLGMITATEQTDENNVLVEWDWAPAELIVDFETGDFSQAEFTLPAQYPWAITTTNPYEGTYCMKSTCEGIASGSSTIEVTVEVPYDAKMGFWVRVSSESNYDKFHFYIDGVEQGSALSGQLAYQYKEYAVEAGTHTYKWEYAKDSSVNSNDDCVYVDNITMYRQDVPAPPIQGATVYDFEDQTMMGWTSLDANNDGYGWVSSADPGQYHNSGVSLAGTGHNASQGYVLSGSYSNSAGIAITPDNYLVAPTQISAEDGAQIRFFACAQDASYAAEHFGVAVSTTTATATAFTMVQEWTLTAKGTQGRTDESEFDIRGTRAQGNWYEYTVDLSSYAGQDIWVAIRHFNCNDEFILNVDDITLADGSAKPMVRNDRTFQAYNLYRRDIKDYVDDPDLAPVELIATPGPDDNQYIDNSWANLDYGMYQWGIAATYDGYAPERNRDQFTYGFEGGLDGWTGIVVNSAGGEWIHSDDNLGGYDYSTHAHTGSGFAMCYSFVDYVGSFDTDAFLVSPQAYSIDASSSMSFWADNANDSYPENFSVWVSTAANPTSASDFTQIWSGGAKGTGSDGAAVRHSNDRYDNWRSHEISLSSYAGQNIWIAFRDVNYDMYEIWIDDVTITAGSSTPTPTPLPVPTASGESEILWSNVIDKDMISNVTVNVALNNNQAPTGAVVSFDGPETYTANVDETGTVVFDHFRKGDYTYTVALEGYTGPVDEAISITETTQVIDVILYEIIAPVEDLYVSPTGWAMWQGGTAGGGTTPVGPVGPTTTWTDDFEDGNLTNWTLIDADGDGDSWNAATPAAYGIGNAHSGTYCASSWSWNSVSFDPDQYMISPLSEGASSINYFVATNTGYPDHYGIVVSSTGTNASDFTVVFEETAGSKGVIGGAKSTSTLNGGTREMSAWIEKTVDLPAGTKYVGFRHWNSYDMNYLFIDDVTITMGGAKGDRAALSYKVKLDGNYEGETPNPYYQHDVEGFEAGSEHTTEVAAVYATGMGDWVSYDWIYTPCTEYNGVTDYTAAAEGNTVTLNWTLSNNPNPNPNPNPGPTTTTTYDFESGMDGWTSLDADGDGNGWVLGSTAMGTGYGHNGSSDLVLSKSYDNTTGVLYPDNYLVSPAKAEYASISFYACAQDASYAAEHYGVAVSTGGATASEFVMVQEWTMSAKDGGMVAPGRDGQMRAQGTWYEKTVDLSAYAGQQIWVAIRHFNCSDMFYLDVDDITLAAAGSKGNRDMWDLVTTFTGTSAGQQAIATDGEFFYTASWQATPTGGHTFYKYDLQGNFVEGFEITGATGIRDLTYDGQYFYGSSGGAQIFCMDFTNKTLVSTINCSGLTSRHLTYDPVRDGFWSGNWSTLALYSRTGSLIQNGPAPTSAYGSAYYKDADDVEHLYLFCQPNSDCMVYDYNITTGTLGSSVVLDFSSNTPGCTGIAGGCFIGNYDNKVCWMGNSQQDPNLVGIYELEAGTNPNPNPNPNPTPGELLGVYVFRDGELISGQTALTTGTYTDTNVEAGVHEYCVRVVYSDYAMSCPQCETVEIDEVTCDPVTDLTAELYNYNGNDGALVDWTAPEGATSFKIYVNGELLGSIAGHPVFINFEGSADDTYEIGIVAVYDDCESDMATVDFTWDAIGENEIVNNLYPNPTNDKVTIEAQGMNHITVATALGQVVYDADVDADQIELNMGQYNAGLYLVRISTVNGVSVKRVTVVK